MKRIAIILTVIILPLMFMNCGESVHKKFPNQANQSLSSPPGTSGAGATGAQLFSARCTGCHGAITAFGPRTVAQITTALSTIPAMAGVASFTTAEEIKAISDATNGITTTVGSGVPAALTGQQLYQVNCQGCHGLQPPGGSRSANGIARAILEKDEMRNLSALTSAQLQSIADYVAANLRTD